MVPTACLPLTAQIVRGLSEFFLFNESCTEEPGNSGTRQILSASESVTALTSVRHALCQAGVRGVQEALPHPAFLRDRLQAAVALLTAPRYLSADEGVTSRPGKNTQRLPAAPTHRG